MREASEITIRPALISDLELIQDFNARMAMETENLSLDREVLKRGVLRAFESHELSRYFVAVLDKQVVGQLMVTFEVSDWRDGVIWWIQSVYVVPEFRNKGVFRRLFEFVEAKAKGSSKVKALRLYVDKGNTSAIQTYRILGLSTSHYELMEKSLEQ